MKKVLFILFVATFAFSSCKYSSGNIFYEGNHIKNRDTKLTEIPGPEIQTNVYTVLLITDKHTGSSKAENNEEKIFQWIEKQPVESRPKFILDLGDSTDTGSEKEFTDYKAFCDKLKAMGIPVYSTPGNHDLYNSGWKNWKAFSTTGNAFYKFSTGKFSWYSFDTATGNVGVEPISEMKKAFSADPNPKIVFTHYPVITDRFIFCLQDTTERNILLDLFAKNNVKMTFGGHIHKNTRYDMGNYESITISSFLYSGKIGILTVNESEESVKFETLKIE